MPGDELSLRTDRSPWEVTTPQGRTVGRLARSFESSGRVHSARVRAVVIWQRADSALEYQDSLRCDEWEVVVPELVFEGASNA